MQIGLIGLGKMGYNLGLNLLDHGHDVVANDINDDQMEQFKQDGGKAVGTFKELAEALDTPRVIWLMVPAGDITEKVLDGLMPSLDKDDIVIDGGNSNYKDTLRRAEKLRDKGVSYIDAGTSGGVDGAREGACFMVGGPQDAFEKVEQIFKDISVENGYLYTGPEGSGHYLKMVHNGIEYGMMAAIAEGFEILEKGPYDYDYKGVSRVWNNGSVIRSWLMELMENAFSKDPKLDEIRGVMNSSGEGKWTVDEALDLEMAAPIITMSLMMRYRSQEDDTFTGKVVAALRNEFGGHATVKAE